MAEQELQVIHLKDDFYRDGFYKAIVAFLIVMCGVVSLIVVSVFLFLLKPIPVQFVADDDWRIMKPVPINQPYLRAPDVLQWVSSVLPNLFNFSFVHYKEELSKSMPYFTADGWQKYTDILNGFVNYATITNGKLFTSAVPTGAPIILNQGMLQGKYAWWIQMPLSLTYVGTEKSYTQEIQAQALVVRVSTLNNLDGVSIDNIIVTKT